MDTETLDRLYLEWSQFTGARNGREINLRSALDQILAIAKAGRSSENQREIALRNIEHYAATALKTK